MIGGQFLSPIGMGQPIWGEAGCGEEILVVGKLATPLNRVGGLIKGQLWLERPLEFGQPDPRLIIVEGPALIRAEMADGRECGQ